jgi:hypothetical protein
MNAAEAAYEEWAAKPENANDVSKRVAKWAWMAAWEAALASTQKKDVNGFTAEERAGYLNEAIDEVDYRFESLRDATTLGEQASAFERLSDAMSDLKTWHPKYDLDRGIIQRDEE